MISWAAKFLASPREIGAVAPSSPSLARLMTRDIPLDARVLELGPGTGAVTSHILLRIPASQLTIVERDADLCEACAARFPDARTCSGDAESLLHNEDATYDVIVSGLPFAIMDGAKRARIFRLISERLNDGGRFVMFQYSKTTLAELKTIFGSVDVRFTPWNLPPAFVFVARCYREKDAERKQTLAGPG